MSSYISIFITPEGSKEKRKEIQTQNHMHTHAGESHSLAVTKTTIALCKIITECSIHVQVYVLYVFLQSYFGTLTVHYLSVYCLTFPIEYLSQHTMYLFIV